MKRALSFALLLAALCLPAAAQAEFGFEPGSLDVTYTNADGSPAMQAGSHPYAYTTAFHAQTKLDEEGKVSPDEAFKDIYVDLPPGFLAATGAVPSCSSADFLASVGNNVNLCPDASAVGTARVIIGHGPICSGPGCEGSPQVSGVYSLAPAPGSVFKFGFIVLGVPITFDAGLSPDPPYNGLAKITNISQALLLFSSRVTLWGIPADPAHDDERGNCAGGGALCPLNNTPPKPFLTMPPSCAGPLLTGFRARSWENPAAWITAASASHDNSLPPGPLGTLGCAKLGFAPEISAQPTARAASSPTGLDFGLDVPDEGISNPDGLAGSDIKKAVVTLPEGMSVNPSQAEGLEVCTEAQLHAETPFSAPGAGCPEASKIGTIEVETPLLPDQVLKGSLYIAKPYENQVGSLLALYIVIKDPQLGINVIQPAKVTPDPLTGQLVTTTEDMPQLPFSHFRLHFREGARSPLITPPACGSFAAEATLYPWSGGPPATSHSAFQIISGPDAGPCPTGGLPPFHPGLIAGTTNNAAGHFSPFNVRLSRTDSEQEFTHFSIKLPPGVVGKLAGIATCSDAAITAAIARTGPLGGHEELAAPSCPASSYVGRTLAGSGVGPALAYAPGRIYLAGPYHGAPLSFVAITAGVVGPFDIGTVVVRLALRIDPETAEVFLDATGSDPIPHIVKGIPVHLRDIRAYTDRPEFVLNPTSCEPTSTATTLLGSGLDFVSAADDNPIVVSTRFQAADCAALPFKPKLSFRLVGGTKRGQNPSLRAHVAMNGFGEAAIQSASVALPRSEFLDNAHIGTVCTRVQFREGTVPGERCPAASVYGHVSALTPILDGPLSGPIYLRSSEHELPDLVAALHHAEINIALVGRVDSVKGGGIRNTFEFVPDAPVTSADFVFDGAAKGLLENSTNICKGTHKVTVKLKGHNGKVSNYKTPLKAASCKGRKKSKRAQLGGVG